MEPIPVSTGFGWTAAGAWSAVILLLGIIVRQIAPWRKQTIQAQERLRDDLIGRVTELEHQLGAQAEKYEKQISEQGAAFQAKLDNEREAFEDTSMIMRHRLNNITACFDAFLMLVKSNPEKAAEAVILVEEMRAKQVIAEATEKATLRGVRASVTLKDDPDGRAAE